MSKKVEKVHQFYLITPAILKSLLNTKPLSHDKQIIHILNNDRINNLNKLHSIHNLLVSKNSERNEKKNFLEEKVISNTNEDFNPGIHSSPIKEHFRDEGISKELRSKILSSFVFPRNKEEIFETSLPVIGNEIDFDDNKAQSDTELDISNARQSFLRNIETAANKKIDDVRDLSVGNLTDDRSFVNVRNRKTDSLYTVEKPSAFREKKKNKRKKKKDIEQKDLHFSPKKTRSGIDYHYIPKKKVSKIPTETSFIRQSSNADKNRRDSNFMTQWNKMAQYLLQKE